MTIFIKFNEMDYILWKRIQYHVSCNTIVVLANYGPIATTDALAANKCSKRLQDEEKHI